MWKNVFREKENYKNDLDFQEWLKKQEPIITSQFRVRKTIVFIVIFLENSKNFVIFTKSSNKFGEFLKFLGFSKIFIHFLRFS